MTALIEAHPHATDFKTARQIRVPNGGLVSAGDLAFCYTPHGIGLGEVWYHISVDGLVQSVVSLFDRVGDALAARARASTFRRRDAPQAMPISDVLVAATYSNDGDCVIALLPPWRP